MKPHDPAMNWIEEPQLGMAGKMYLPLFLQGLSTTTRHLFQPKVTVSFPEERPKIGNPLIYRGVHRLNKDAEGRVKCVACFLCATACPAHCIDIVGGRKPLARPGKVSRELHHRRVALHLLRHVRRGLPGRRHRADEPVRPDWPQPRRNDFRQGKVVERVRPDQGRRTDAVREPWEARCESATQIIFLVGHCSGRARACGCCCRGAAWRSPDGHRARRLPAWGSSASRLPWLGQVSWWHGPIE